MLKSSSDRPKKAKMETVYKNRSKKKASTRVSKDEEQQRKIDRILDKISSSGYESLTKEEKDFLFKAGKE